MAIKLDRRSTFLLIGFIVVLGLVYAGFELYATGKSAGNSGPPDVDPITVTEINIPATDQTPPPPPQTAKEVLFNLVKANPTFHFDRSVYQIPIRFTIN